MRSGFVEGDPGIPDPIARLLRAIGQFIHLAAGRQRSLHRRSRPATQNRTATSNDRLIGAAQPSPVASIVHAEAPQMTTAPVNAVRRWRTSVLQHGRRL